MLKEIIDTSIDLILFGILRIDPYRNNNYKKVFQKLLKDKSEKNFLGNRSGFINETNYSSDNSLDPLKQILNSINIDNLISTVKDIVDNELNMSNVDPELDSDEENESDIDPDNESLKMVSEQINVLKSNPDLLKELKERLEERKKRLGTNFSNMPPAPIQKSSSLNNNNDINNQNISHSLPPPPPGMIPESSKTENLRSSPSPNAHQLSLSVVSNIIENAVQQIQPYNKKLNGTDIRKIVRNNIKEHVDVLNKNTSVNIPNEYERIAQQEAERTAAELATKLSSETITETPNNNINTGHNTPHTDSPSTVTTPTVSPPMVSPSTVPLPTVTPPTVPPPMVPPIPLPISNNELVKAIDYKFNLLRFIKNMEYIDETPIKYTFKLLKFIKNMEYIDETPVEFNFYLSKYLKSEITNIWRLQ